jgi:hypothetical protein
LENDYLLAHDLSGELVQNIEKWRTELVNLSVTKPPFSRLSIMQNEYYSYTKED